jgi:hypothetical protein
MRFKLPLWALPALDHHRIQASYASEKGSTGFSGVATGALESQGFPALACDQTLSMLVKYSSIRRAKMRTIAIVLATSWLAGAAMAEDSCTVQATAKNLHGAALNSFAKKCCKDQASAQKLHGAAEKSFTKKCVTDAGVT